MNPGFNASVCKNMPPDKYNNMGERLIPGITDPLGISIQGRLPMLKKKSGAPECRGWVMRFVLVARPAIPPLADSRLIAPSALDKKSGLLV